jgi:hypothetical protein
MASGSNRFSVARAKGNIAPQDPTQCPPGIDLSTYFFPSIPDEIKLAVPIFHASPFEKIQNLIKVIMNYLCQHSEASTTTPENVYDQSISVDDTNTVLSALYFIIRIALRNKVKLSVIRVDLLKMNVPANVVDELSNQVKASRTTYETRILASRLQYKQLERFRWRVDVVISSGSLTRVMRPNIIAQVSFFLFISHTNLYLMKL